MTIWLSHFRCDTKFSFKSISFLFANPTSTWKGPFTKVESLVFDKNIICHLLIGAGNDDFQRLPVWF